MLKAYYQIIKPGIIYGNILTTIAGYLMACDLHLDLKSFVGAVIGFCLVIGSACTLNNLADRSIDANMERTKKRPSVTGVISLKAGLIYASVLLGGGVVLLVLFTNITTLVVGLVGFVVYVSAYTYSKRKTDLATLIGSVSGATPIVGGYTAFAGHFTLTALIIGMMMLVWQMPHFYAIAIYREKEYRRAKIPVLPITSGYKTTSYWMVFYSFLFLLLSVSLYVYGPVGIAYLLVMSVVGALWLAFNLKGLFLKTFAGWAKQDFRYSLIVLLVMSLMIALR